MSAKIKWCKEHRLQGKSEGEGEKKRERGKEDYEYGGLIEKRKKIIGDLSSREHLG